jgi:FkbM family methyltransferase
MSAFTIEPYRKLRGLIGTLKRNIRAHVGFAPNDYLKSCKGVIHVGANTGQERDIYRQYGLNVFWIEPIPEIYHRLLTNIATYQNQRACMSLITDKDDADYILHIANNDGASSSILSLHHHRDIWPSIEYERDIHLKSQTLPAALSKSGANQVEYDALVIDTQGTELLVLKGAVSLLRRFKYIKTEAANFESYQGCATIGDIVTYLRPYGFRVIREDLFAQRAAGGAYFDILFKREI